MSKYWNYKKLPVNDNAKLLRNSVPGHDVTHRDVGDIPGCTYLPQNERYRGKFPSEEAIAFINSLKNKMKYFDDGERLVYDGKPFFKYVELSDVIHPISYPPAGFELVNGQWVYKGD